jgi:hypothetical protein
MTVATSSELPKCKSELKNSSKKEEERKHFNPNQSPELRNLPDIR